jgi:lipoprotein-releasing system ATP-binding protein
MDLVLEHIQKTYPSAAGPLPVLRDINLQLARGEALAITGPSGSGKSTLLYLMGTLDEPTGGRLTVLGQDPFALSATELAEFRNSRIGFVFQDHCLLPQCTVLENVLIPTLAGTGAGSDEDRRARTLLERVGLTGRIDHRPAELSGGERQRVAICRALINRPSLVLADEPTGNLDRQTAHTIGNLLREVCREQNAMLVAVTHSLELAGQFSLTVELAEGKMNVTPQAQTAVASSGAAPGSPTPA